MTEAHSTELSNTGSLEREAALTRIVLGKAAVNKPSWAPPGAVRSIGSLTAHLAEIPKWTITILEASHYDFAEAALRELERSKRGGAQSVPSRDELLASFDSNVSAALEALREAKSDVLDGPWQLRRSGRVIETRPRSIAIRYFVIDHLIHHRGQLTVYLRMLGVSVPGIYGPSADEPYIGELL
jgi:uncharacterized damage-inducible protein DinB